RRGRMRWASPCWRTGQDGTCGKSGRRPRRARPPSPRRLDQAVEPPQGTRAHLPRRRLRLDGDLLASERIASLARLRGRLVDRLELDQAVEVELSHALLAEVGGDDRGERVEHF